MRELFVEKVIDTTGEFLDNNQRIKLKEILAEICVYYKIVKSPVRRIHKVKSTKKVKETLTDENLEKLRDTCSNAKGDGEFWHTFILYYILF